MLFYLHGMQQPMFTIANLLDLIPICFYPAIFHHWKKEKEQDHINNRALNNIYLSQRAIEEGADFIETDILASKDGALICFHDVTLDATTDVASRKEFSNRRRTYEVEWFNVTGWFVGLHITTKPNSIPRSCKCLQHQKSEIGTNCACHLIIS